MSDTNNSDAALIIDLEATGETASLTDDTYESVWDLIKDLTGVKKRPQGFKKVVGSFDDWDRFITMPLNYYTDLFTFSTTPLQRQCRKFALMCDYVVKYYQLVDYFCIQATIHRDRLRLCTTIALQAQMMNLSKVKLPIHDNFTGKDEDWPTWKEKSELTLSGLGFEWVTPRDASPPPSMMLKKI